MLFCMVRFGDKGVDMNKHYEFIEQLQFLLKKKYKKKSGRRELSALLGVEPATMSNWLTKRISDTTGRVIMATAKNRQAIALLAKEHGYEDG